MADRSKIYVKDITDLPDTKPKVSVETTPGVPLTFANCMTVCLERNGSIKDPVQKANSDRWCRYICQTCQHRQVGNDILPK